MPARITEQFPVTIGVEQPLQQISFRLSVIILTTFHNHLSLFFKILVIRKYIPSSDRPFIRKHKLTADYIPYISGRLCIDSISYKITPLESMLSNMVSFPRTFTL
jgi:hypothetical protein